MPADVGTDSSPMLTPVLDSMNLTLMSDGAASKSHLASSVMNFTWRSGPRRMEATPAEMSRLTMLVIAGDADSIGNGRMGALGKGSRATAGAAEPRCAAACCGAAGAPAPRPGSVAHLAAG